MTRLWETVLRRGVRNEATLEELLPIFGDPNRLLLNSSWGNLSNEELISSLTDAYTKNGPVYALTLARMQVFSQARFQWTRSTDGTPNDLFGSKDLQILEFPWPGARTSALLKRLEVDNATAGNCFVRRLGRSPFRSSSLPDRLVRLRPQWVTIVMGSTEDTDAPWEAPDVEVIGYAYKPNGDASRLMVFGPEEVAHYAPTPDPVANFRGMSWVTPSLTTMRGDDASEQHKLKFFINGATPNLVMSFDPSVKQNEIDVFKAAFLKDKAGVANAYKTLFLGGGADPKVIGKDFQQLSFAATQAKGETRLAADAGVPPSWVGFSEGLQGSSLNDGNYGASRRRFADGTIQDLWESAATALEGLVDRPTNIVNGKPAPPARLTVDPRSIPFLREDIKDASQSKQQDAVTISTLVREGFTPDSAVAAVAQGDWSLLVHTGLTSVQLQPPGTGSNTTQEGGSDA